MQVKTSVVKFQGCALLALCAYGIAMAFVAKNARANGDAAQRMANLTCVDTKGIRCLGPVICHRECASKLHGSFAGLGYVPRPATGI